MPLMILGLAAGLWATCYFFEYFTHDVSAKLFWRDVKYPFIAIIPVALASFVLRFSGWRQWPSKPVLIILLIVPALTSILVLTNQFHHLFWKSYELIVQDGSTELRSEYGPWFWVHASYSYLVIISSIVVALTMWGNTWRVYRQPIILLAVGIALPLLANVLSLIGIQPWPGLDLSPVAFGLSAIFMLAAARLSKFLNVIPLAHDSLVEQMRDGVLVVDNERRILEINRAAAQIFSVDKKDVIGKPTASLDHPALNLVTNTLTGKTARHEIEISHGESAHWYDVRISAIRTSSDEIAGYMVIWHNITERKLIERELRHTATHDTLTGVHNRVFFEEAMKFQTHNFQWPVTVISVDLDNLKETNDQLGHPAGDELIRQAAAVLSKTFRQGDFVARIGGDEFAVLVMQSDESTAKILMQRLREMAAHHNANTPRVRLEFSAGYAVAYYVDELKTALNEADHRMYAEKNQHKGDQGVR
jgi:diguanylate cyclase (GGDEF)-like protein/PAS domain S-box-containing protein